MNKLFKFTLVFITLILFAILILVIKSGYNNIIIMLITNLKLIKYQTKIFNLITIEKFNILIYILAFINLLFIFITYKNQIIYNSTLDFLLRFKKSLLNIFNNSNNLSFILLLLISTISTIYFAITTPIIYDEAWTYINFSSKSIITSISYYPAPNNHILHSICTNLAVNLPFSPTFNIRIPSIIFNIILMIFSYSFLSNFFHKNISLLIITVIHFIFLNIYYSFLSRGYTLFSLFFIISTYSSFKIIENQKDNFYWTIYAIANILGFYTIPTFLYPFLLINVFIIIVTKKITLKHFYNNIFITIVVLILYSPIIIVNGIKSLTGNEYIVPIERIEIIKQLPNYFNISILEIIGINGYYLLPILLFSLYKLIYSKINKSFKIYILVFSLILPFIFIFHSIIPPTRTLKFLIFIISILLIYPFIDLMLKFKYLLITVILMLITFLIFNFNSKIKTIEDYAFDSKNTIPFIKNGSNFRVHSNLFDTYLIYYLKTNNINYDNIKYSMNGQISADTINNYDFIVIDKSKDCTQNKKTKFSNVYLNIY